MGFPIDWYKDPFLMYAPAGRILMPAEIAAAAIYWLADESGPIQWTGGGSRTTSFYRPQPTKRYNSTINNKILF